MNLRRATEKALEALEYATQCAAMIECHHAAEILRAALAEADEPDETGLYHNRIHEEMPNSRPAYAVRAEAEEPVAWYHPSGEGYDSAFRDHSTVMACDGGDWSGWVPLYTHPPRREPLTDEAIRDLWSWSSTHEAEQTATTQQHAFARAVERAHGIGTDENAG